MNAHPSTTPVARLSWDGDEGSNNPCACHVVAELISPRVPTRRRRRRCHRVPPRACTPSQVLLEAGYLAKEPAAARPVVYLAVVDECGGQEYHDVMAEASA